MENSREFKFDFEKLSAGMNDLLRNSEGAKLIGVAPRTLRQYRLKGLIPAIKYGRNSYRFVKSDLIDFMKSNYDFHSSIG